MNPWIQTLITIICSVLASSGFWAFMVQRMENRDVKTEMLLGLGHDRIINLGMTYIDRGYITKDEYENLHVYLFTPYKRMGGNGSATKIMNEVDNLRIYNSKLDYEMRNENK